MPAFQNQATLSYNGISVTSNTVTGEIVDVLSATKTAVPKTYTEGGEVTYVISLVNSGDSALTGLTVTDNLGAYSFGATTLVPLTYETGSATYLVGGVPQASPAVTAGPPLVFTGITVPAGGNTTIVYRADVTEYAPLASGGTVVNTATVSGDGINTPITVTETVTANGTPKLSISKAVTPTTVTENGTLTYTFVIENTGSAEADASANIAVSDTFNPVLNPITVTLNGTTLAAGTDYTYDTSTGVFATVPGKITVPAATFTQDTTTGVWTVTPGTSELVVSGTV